MEKEYSIVLKNRKNKVVDNYYKPGSYDIDIIEKMLDMYNEAIKVYNCKLQIIDEKTVCLERGCLLRKY